ncbi:tyrosine-type recombinase/integrase [Burkholderia sp. IMCC1007]|uniref:tyrosine-type recombinase/integrase n=1 Tax=Burkholderia sp. IMCC1007 TaxID=3004104 RepID=UPI0022B52818|nr:site-specific integrase [Burkholderia sp. IMCC1007]
MSRLNNRLIERARPTKNKGDTFLSDGDGLVLRVSRTGTKTFCFRYSWGEKRRLMTLGPYPLMLLPAARELAAAARQKLFDGVDPMEGLTGHLTLERAPEQAVVTVRTMAADRTEQYAKPTYKRQRTQLQMVEKDILPVIGDRPVSWITPTDTAAVITKVVARGARVKANRVLSLMKTIFGWAKERGYIAEMPVLMTRRSAGGREKGKNRQLTVDEIRTAWLALDNHAGMMNWRTKRALQLIILTAQRPGEVAAMQWDHIDLQKRLWVLPAEVVKSDRDHIVHLSDPVIAILNEAWSVSAGERYVMPGNKGKRKVDRPTGTQTLSKALLDMFAAGEFKGIRKFTPHDLRRTAASRMGDMSIHAHIIEKILNHRMKGVLAIYNHADYLSERSRA